MDRGVHRSGDRVVLAQKTVDPGDTLTRFGRKRETLKDLTEQAAAAEIVIGVHRVSTRLNSARRGKKALLADVKAAFPGTRQTGSDEKHHTVVLPKPVTQEDVDAFNELFPPTA